MYINSVCETLHYIESGTSVLECYKRNDKIDVLIIIAIDNNRKNIKIKRK